MSILSVKGLTKIYGNNENKVVALDNISFEVEKGEFIAIKGASGSGKSTLLHLLSGVDRPTKGSVVINGVDLYTKNEKDLAKFRRANIGLVYQFYNLIPVLTVEENIALPLLLSGREADNTEMNTLLKRLGLVAKKDRLPNELSGGQQQRVSVGRAIITKPIIMLCDEPTGNLDKNNSIQIMSLIKQANEIDGQTLIVITHDDEIAQMATRIIEIEDGKIISDERKRYEDNK